MQLQLLSQLDTIQQYIVTLFDNLPQINTKMIDVNQEIDVIKIVEQNIQYGKKIIQLSDKFTAKYRKEHLMNRKDIQEKICWIFKIICPYHFCTSLDQMVTLIVKKLQQNPSLQELLANGKSSNQPQQLYLNIDNQTNQSQSSHLCQRDLAECVDGQYEQSEGRRGRNNESCKDRTKPIPSHQPSIESTDMKRKKSVNRPRLPKKSTTTRDEDSNFTAKNVLQIKQFFESQQNCMRKIFDKLNKIINQPSSSSANGIKISQQNRQLTKCINDVEKDNFKDFVQVHVECNNYNLNKIYEIFRILEEHLEKNNKVEMVAKLKFNLYIEEINKKEEVFSFTVSKILEHISILKEYMEHKVPTTSEQKLPSQRLYGKSSNSNEVEQLNPLEIVESLEQIGQGLYDLYPSIAVIQEIKVKSRESGQMEYSEVQMQRRGFRNQSVQVSMGRAQSERSSSKEILNCKKMVIQLYKMSTKINEVVQKFEKLAKYKKVIEVKQVEKLMESIRESVPRKSMTNLPNEVVAEVQSYKEEYKKIVECNERNEKQIADEYSKKIKKYEKYIQGLEKSIEEMAEEHKKQQQKMECSNRKLSRKLDNEKQEIRKVSTFKSTLQKNIKEMSNEIARLHREQKSQYQKFEDTQKMLINQRKTLQKQLELLKQQNQALATKGEVETSKILEEREIYQQKIIFLETQEESKNEQIGQIKEELEEMIKQNTVLKKQIQELTEVYEKKIRELDELIENIKELEMELKGKDQQIGQSSQKNNIIEKEKNKAEKEIEKLVEKLKEKEAEAEKFRELGVLNDSDIDILKEEMEKVKYAYVQSEQQLQQLKSYTNKLESDKQLLLRQNKYLKRQSESSHSKAQSSTLNNERLEKQLRESQEEAHQKKRQVTHMGQQLEQIKREFSKVKKQASEGRESNIKLEAEVRNVRQELQKKTESESLESGKRKLELQGAKVELRRKTEEITKIRESYEQKLEMLEQKNKELSQFISQKQLLAKITNSHLSS